jgi:hypothetical protein
MTDHNTALRTLLAKVEAGDHIALTVNGVTLHYRARKAAERFADLKLRDLQPDPATDASAMLSRAMIAGGGE